MNCRPAVPAILLLVLAPAGLTRAQEEIKKAGANDAVPLYDLQGATLIDSLEKNFYGRDPGQSLTLRDSIYLFSPTDPRDHLATHFVQLPPGKARAVKISLTFLEPELSGSNLIVLVQDGGLATLQELRPLPNSAATLSFVQDVSIPGSASTLRLAFLSAELKPTNLPDRVKIEYYGPGKPVGEGFSAGFYILVAALAITAVAVILRLRRKKPA
jgi:hypothetical protein